MREHEAEQLLDMMKDNWNMFLSDAAKGMWLSFLLDQDGEIATKAVLRLVKTEPRQPTVSDVQETILMFSPDRGLPRAGHCDTCGDDRFVIVQKVPPLKSQWIADHGGKQSEEPVVELYAPCPDCTSGVDTSFRRGSNGSKVETMDPARVRELMQR